ncbi:4352_t:CDS:2 [Dentiscutata heterogama]|uniref:4352_t:CDS:1 n=1 Tax=Dentiscutata heterogama TaxID=1316150 RepID=A0ACA9K232_9GLOM|nr:4352_t:CDS:2 [Dentiscutata heterogama]
MSEHDEINQTNEKECNNLRNNELKAVYLKGIRSERNRGMLRIGYFYNNPFFFRIIYVIIPPTLSVLVAILLGRYVLPPSITIVWVQPRILFSELLLKIFTLAEH